VIPPHRWWASYKAARRTREERMIGTALWHAPELTVASLMEETGLGAGAIYPALRRMERAGRVTPRWDDSRPRRRLYRLADQQPPD